MSSVVEENELFEFEETEEVEQSDEERPSMLSAEWNGYVMSMFFDNELIEGNPMWAEKGCRTCSWAYHPERPNSSYSRYRRRRSGKSYGCL